jgi:pyrroloquinoline quinone biosynthesis protein D
VNAHRSGQAAPRGSDCAPRSTLAHRARRTYGFAVIDDADVPRLVRRVRLRWDATRNAHVLLFPEGVLMLNPAAAEVLTRVDGARSVGVIVAELRALHDDAPPAAIAHDVHELLLRVRDRGFLTLGAEGA